MFLFKTYFLCTCFFMLVEGKSYGKNWYPKKYSHSIHKRVDPNYWDGFTFGNHLLSIQPLSEGNVINSIEENDFFHSRPWLHEKKYFSFIDVSSPPEVILKRYKREEELHSKNQQTKPKKIHDCKVQKREKSINNSIKHGKIKFSSMEKMH